MAKISAHGATAVEWMKIGDRVFVLCSDGRVLYATLFSEGSVSGYHVCAKITEKDGRIMFAKKREPAGKR